MTRGKVIYVAGEGVHGMGPRVLAWKQLRDVSGTAGVLFLPKALTMREPADVKAFVEVAAAHSPVLVVLDTLARCMVGKMRTLPRIWACL